MDFFDFRQEGRIDINEGINNGTIVKDEIESRGARFKFWFNKHNYMYKEIYEGSYEDFAEVIATELAEELEIECAEYDFAIYNGKRGVVTKNVAKEAEGDNMISGTEIIKEVFSQCVLPVLNLKQNYYNILQNYVNNYGTDKYQYDTSVKQQMIDELNNLYSNFLEDYPIGNNHINNNQEITIQELDDKLNNICEILNDATQMYDENFIDYEKGVIVSNNLFDLWSVLDNYCKISGLDVSNADDMMKNLTNLFVYDIITSQGDRHGENWSIIVNKNNNTIRLSPIYDNSNICNLNRKKTLRTIKDNIDVLEATELSDKKRERIRERLRTTIFHANSALKVEPSDVLNRQKNPYLMDKFVRVSSSDIIHSLEEKFKKISPEKLEQIYQRIEYKSGILIPDIVKQVVSTTISNNVAEFCSCIQKEGKTI